MTHTSAYKDKNYSSCKSKIKYFLSNILYYYHTYFRVRLVPGASPFHYFVIFFQQNGYLFFAFFCWQHHQIFTLYAQYMHGYAIDAAREI